MIKKAPRETLTNTMRNIAEEMNAVHPSVENFIKKFSRRGFGAMLLFPAVLVILPTGAIPGMPILVGLFVILVSIQMLMGHTSPWLPKRIRSITFARQNLSKLVETAEPYTKKIDRIFRPRWRFIFNPIIYRLIALSSLVLGFAIIAFGFIPFAVLLPGLALALIALGLAARDGLFTVLGLAVFSGCFFMVPKLIDTLKALLT